MSAVVDCLPRLLIVLVVSVAVAGCSLPPVPNVVAIPATDESSDEKSQLADATVDPMAETPGGESLGVEPTGQGDGISDGQAPQPEATLDGSGGIGIAGTEPSAGLATEDLETGNGGGGVAPDRATPSGPTSSEVPDNGTPAKVSLSAGVALPQSLPVGTSMFFGVGYQFTQGRPDPSATYFLVVIPTKAERFTVDVSDQIAGQSGSLKAVALRMQPSVGPFRAYLEVQVRSRSRRAVSPTVPLQSTGRGF